MSFAFPFDGLGIKGRVAHSPAERGLDMDKHEEESPYSNFEPDGGNLEDAELALPEDNSIMDVTDASIPSNGFRSFQQRDGDVSVLPQNGIRSTGRSKGIAYEAPAGAGLETRLSERNEISLPIAIGNDSMEAKLRKRLEKQRSFSSDIDRDEAWQRKRDLYLTEMEKHTETFISDSDVKLRTIRRSISDCNDRTWPLPCMKARSRTRTRSLTDEDMEELRGCIDLGFGFSDTEGCDLRNTLPALDLYYAINRQYTGINIRSSPVSTVDAMTIERSFNNESPYSPLSETWKISSPGDHPNQVKTRLRHWAQAVACSIRQSLLV